MTGTFRLFHFSVPLRHKVKGQGKVKVKVKGKVVGAAHTCQRRCLWTPQGAIGPLTPTQNLQFCC